MTRGLALALLLLLALAGAVEARAVRFEMAATDEGFRVVGADGINPHLAIEGGDEVTIVLVNRASAPHNVHVGAPIDQALPCCLYPDEERELRFTVPRNATGGIPYWSDTDAESYRGTFLVGPPLPRVRIVSPADGATVGARVEVAIEVENFVLEPFPAGNEPAQGRGHVRFLHNGQNASTLSDRTTFTLENLPVGHHLVRVELVDRDGSPLDPPASHEILLFRAAEPTPVTGTNIVGTPPPPKNGIPTAGTALLVLALVSASMSRRPRR